MQTTLPPVLFTDWRQAFIANREKTFAQIYARAYPVVLHYVKQHNGQPEDAQDLLQEAIIIFYEKVMQEQFKLTSSITTYLMGICKNLWRQELEKQRRKNASPEDIDLVDDPAYAETLFPGLELTHYVAQLGNKCRDILVSFYYLGQSISAIAEQNNYRTVRSATVQKFKCLERLRHSLASFTAQHFR